MNVNDVIKRAKAISPDCDKFVVRLYDGFDNEWMDVSKPVSEEEAKRIWLHKTDNGSRATSYGDIDYYSIYPVDAKMMFSQAARDDGVWDR